MLLVRAGSWVDRLTDHKRYISPLEEDVNGRASDKTTAKQQDALLLRQQSYAVGGVSSTPFVNVVLQPLMLGQETGVSNDPSSCKSLVDFVIDWALAIGVVDSTRDIWQ